LYIYLRLTPLEEAGMEYSERDRQYASLVVDALFSGNGERINLEFEQGLVISDLEGDADTFSAELDFAASLGVNIPAVKISGEDSYVPVSLLSILGLRWSFLPGLRRSVRNRWRPGTALSEWAYGILKQYSDDQQIGGYHTVNRDEAQETFTKRAISFLATRIVAVRSRREGEIRENDVWGKPATLNILQKAGGSRVTTPGCYFSVSTNSNGLRVFWSGAYYITPNYFSHPTSPATSVLQAGVYVFGVDGGAYGSMIQWDTNAVVSLPGKPFVHLNY
jgi:hypothetical protein